MNRTGHTKLNRRGMTMAEMLITVAIITVLAGVAFIAVSAYQRSLAQLERDNTAKEIFIAAQNHLTAARGEGYTGTGSGKKDNELTQAVGNKDNSASSEDDVYYIVVNAGSAGNGDDMFRQMLPFGSIDETVRTGGSYIIRYQKGSGTVMDVFYCTVSGSPARFNHAAGFTIDEYTSTVSSLSGDDNKAARKNCDIGNDKNIVIGWYGGTDGIGKGKTLTAPAIEVVNTERLTVNVWDRNTEGSIRLIITGRQSGAQKYFDLLRGTGNAANVTYIAKGSTTGATDSVRISSYNEHIVVLDDITDKALHFASLFAPGASDASRFIPGEDITIRAVAFNNAALSNIPYSNEVSTNSLFASIGEDDSEDIISNSLTLARSLNASLSRSTRASSTSAKSGVVKTITDGIKTIVSIPQTRLAAGSTSAKLAGTAGGTSKPLTVAYISNMRHLANIDKSISAVNRDTNTSKLNIVKAEQTDDMSWKEFLTSIRTAKSTDDIKVYGIDISDSGTADNCWRPVCKPVTDEIIKDTNGFIYNGAGHSISGVSVSGVDNAGLFGTLNGGKILNLELRDFDISGTSTAGALAGTVVSSGIENVSAHNSSPGSDDNSRNARKEATTATIKGAASSGGLIGTAKGGAEIGYCSASLVVQGTSAAGGLIGTASASGEVYPQITACYSGGHTELGEYYLHDDSGARITDQSGEPEAIYNVSAGSSGTAGGLIGNAEGASVVNSYSTCSVQGKAENSGGLAGIASGTITHCYAAGLVSGNSDDASNPAMQNVFIGSGSPTITHSGEDLSYYYSIINEVYDTESKTVIYKAPASEYSEYVIAFDEDATEFNKFSGSDWKDAESYDSTLRRNYNSKYNLKTVFQLSGATGKGDNYFVQKHYGDWPSPETFFINE